MTEAQLSTPSAARPSVEDRSSLTDFGVPLGRLIRAEFLNRPEVAIARLRRALRETLLTAEYELLRVREFLEEGRPITIDDFRRELPGITPAIWSAHDLFELEQMHANTPLRDHEERDGIAIHAGAITSVLVESAVCREVEEVNGEMAARVHMTRLVGMLLGADATYDGWIIEDADDATRALERGEAWSPPKVSGEASAPIENTVGAAE